MRFQSAAVPKFGIERIKQTEQKCDGGAKCHQRIHIISLIEEALKTFQKTFKSSKDKQLSIVNEILKTATTGAPKDILKVAGEMQKDINSKGYIEGYLEGRTDFKGNSNLVGGVKAGIKL